MPSPLDFPLAFTAYCSAQLRIRLRPIPQRLFEPFGFPFRDVPCDLGILFLYTYFVPLAHH